MKVTMKRVLRSNFITKNIIRIEVVLFSPKCFSMIYAWPYAFYLGIEFCFFFVSHSDMKDRGSTCKFRNAWSAFRKFTPGSSVFNNTMRENVEFNPYINSLSKLSSFGYEISVFNTQQGGIKNSCRFKRHENGFMEEWMSTKFLCS